MLWCSSDEWLALFYSSDPYYTFAQMDIQILPQILSGNSLSLPTTTNLILSMIAKEHKFGG
jgi:hypothetical protein